MNKQLCRMISSTFEMRIDNSQDKSELLAVLEDIDNSSLLSIDINLLYDYAKSRTCTLNSFNYNL